MCECVSVSYTPSLWCFWLMNNSESCALTHRQACRKEQSIWKINRIESYRLHVTVVDIIDVLHIVSFLLGVHVVAILCIHYSTVYKTAFWGDPALKL